MSDRALGEMSFEGNREDGRVKEGGGAATGPHPVVQAVGLGAGPGCGPSKAKYGVERAGGPFPIPRTVSPIQCVSCITVIPTSTASRLVPSPQPKLDGK